MAEENFSLIEPALAAAGIRVGSGQRAQLETFVALVRHWNRAMNLVGDVERIYSRHVLDCLMLEGLPRPPGAAEMLDMGSGAGLPGIVLAVMHPELRVVSVDSVAKKITFQRVAAQALALENLLPHKEDLAHFARAAAEAGRYGVVVARAFVELERLLVLAAPLLSSGGELWAMKGDRLAEQQAALSPAALEPFEPEPGLYPYRFPEFGGGGVVAVYRRRGEEATAV